MAVSHSSRRVLAMFALGVGQCIFLRVRSRSAEKASRIFVRRAWVILLTWWSSWGAAPSASSCRLIRRVCSARSCLYGARAASLDVWSCDWACLLRKVS
jgi:hypothetical protein